MSNLRNKRGKVKVSSHILFNSEPEFLKAFFSLFYPIEIQNQLITSVYLGMCDSFDELKEGESIPEYECMIKEVREDDTIKYDIKFNKVQS